MPTPFEIAAAMTSAAVDQIYGEREGFQLVGMAPGADVDSVRAPDPTRPAFTVIGAYVAPSKSVWPHAAPPSRDKSGHEYSASVPLVSIDTTLLQWPVATFDRAARLKTGEVFEVSKVLPDGLRRTVLHLTARKRA